MAMTVEKDSLIKFKHRHEFESTNFNLCKILPLINWAWNKSFVGREKNLGAFINIGWLHLDRGY